MIARRIRDLSIRSKLLASAVLVSVLVLVLSLPVVLVTGNKIVSNIVPADEAVSELAIATFSLMLELEQYVKERSLQTLEEIEEANESIEENWQKLVAHADPGDQLEQEDLRALEASIQELMHFQQEIVQSVDSLFQARINLGFARDEAEKSYSDLEELFRREMHRLEQAGGADQAIAELQQALNNLTTVHHETEHWLAESDYFIALSFNNHIDELEEGREPVDQAFAELRGNTSSFLQEHLPEVNKVDARLRRVHERAFNAVASMRVSLDEVEEQEEEIEEALLVAIRTERRRLHNATDTLIWTLVLATVLCLSVAFSLSVFLSRAIATPIQTLEQSVHRFGEGEYDQRVVIHGNDEVGRLAGAFNLMAENINQQRHQLAQALEQAQEASRLKSDFLANMSHEVRTPMNGVIGVLGLLQESQLSQKQERYVEIAQQSADALLVLLNDILDLSRIEAGKLSIEAAPFSIHTIVESVVDLLGGRADERGIRLETECKRDELPEVLVGDPLRIRQVLLNMVSNAIKFTHQGFVKLKVELVSSTVNLRQQAKKAKILFRIEDSGIGLSEEELRNIFEKFSQADSSTTREFGGTGLGLAICRQLVALMGGAIRVESQKGKGSTFSFVLELDVAESSATEKLEESNASSRTVLLPKTTTFVAPVERFDRTLVLLVEDTPASQIVASEILKRLGCEVDLARNGVEAVKMADAKDYAVIFMDCQMPEMDGYQATGEIRKAARAANKRHVPIIALTAHAMHGDREKCINSGMDDYLTKPAKRNEITQMLAKWAPPLEGSRREEAIRTQQLSKMRSHITTKRQTMKHMTSLRILVADDSPVNRDVAKALLELRGHHVELAASGAEAIAMTTTKQKDYQVVLMDLQMDDVDGLEATSIIRSHESDKPLVIIGVTASGHEEDRKRALDAGMDDCIYKPLRADILFDAISNALEKYAATKKVTQTIISEVVETPESEAVDDLSGVIDMDEALSCCDGSIQIFKSVAQAFVDDAPSTSEKIEALAKDGDVVELGRAAHRIKGGSSVIGAMATFRIAKKLVDYSRTANPEPDLAREYAAELLVEIDRAVQALYFLLDAGE